MHGRLVRHDFAMGIAEEIAQGAFDARMLLPFPIATNHDAAQIDRALGTVIQRWRIVPGPSRSQSVTVSPGWKSCHAAPFRPTPKILAAFPAWPGAPVGFSNESDRETRPVSSRYG